MKKWIVIAILARLVGTQAFAQANVVGTFYHGDGLGKNITLEIGTNGD